MLSPGLGHVGPEHDSVSPPAAPLKKRLDGLEARNAAGGATMGRLRSGAQRKGPRHMPVKAVIWA